MFSLSWYLDSVSPNWKALVWGDYDSVFPVTEINKVGIPQVVQPIFTREFSVLGKKQSSESILKFLESHYKNVDLRLGDCIEYFLSKKRTHQILNLDSGFEQNFSKNAKRLIKKAKKSFHYNVISDLAAFFKLIEETLVPKIDEFNSGSIAKLNNLMSKAQLLEKAVCISILDEDNNFVGAGFFFKHKQKITYLKGTATDEAKKSGAMFGLIDHACNLFAEDFKVFDFGGSDLKNVADFYRKFGATNRIYYHYELNSLPFWYKWSKKWLKRG